MQEDSSDDCKKRSIPIYIYWMKQDKMTVVLFFTKLIKDETCSKKNIINCISSLTPFELNRKSSAY